MKEMFLLFSHRLTESQEHYAREKMGVENFVYLPQELQHLWSNVPPDLDSLECYLAPLKEYLNEILKGESVVLVQGDFGAVYQMVNFCRVKNVQSYYATTKRNVIEYTDKNNNSVKESVFEFRRFREYE